MSQRFAEWLQAEVDRLGMGVAGAARAVGVSQSMMSNYLNAKQWPSRATVRKLATYFAVEGATIEALLPTPIDVTEQSETGPTPEFVQAVAREVTPLILREVEAIMRRLLAEQRADALIADAAARDEARAGAVPGRSYPRASSNTDKRFHPFQPLLSSRLVGSRA